MTIPTGWRVEPPDRLALDALNASCISVDRVAPLSGHVLEAASAVTDSQYLSEYDEGRLIAVAVQPRTDPAELCVAPDHRGHGIGSRLLTAVLENRHAVWAHGDLPAAAVLAKRTGLTRSRELVQMRRSLETELPAVTLPDGVRIRIFVPGRDDAAFLAVNARAFAWHPEQGRLDAAGLTVEMAQDWFDPAGFFLAVDTEDQLLGYHWTKVHRVDETPAGAAAAASPIGEIYVLGVDPESPVRKLGAPLSIAGLEYLRGLGMHNALLYAESDNIAAVRLYERLGFTRYLTDVVYRR